MTLMELRISAAEAARTFPDMIERVRAHHEVFVIERAGESICRIGPMAPQRTVRDLVRLLRAAPSPDDGYLDAVEEIANNQPALPETPWGVRSIMTARQFHTPLRAPRAGAPHRGGGVTRHEYPER